MIAAAVGAAAIVAAAPAVLERGQVELHVIDARSRRVLWRGAGPPNERIELHYQHSVERTPVIELFRIAPDGLHLVEMRFVSQGAGLPTEGYVREGDQFVLRTDRRVGDLHVLVSAVAGHRLVVGAARIDLVALAGDGAGVVLQSRSGAWPRR